MVARPLLRAFTGTDAARRRAGRDPGRRRRGCGAVPGAQRGVADAAARTRHGGPARGAPGRPADGHRGHRPGGRAAPGRRAARDTRSRATWPLAATGSVDLARQVARGDGPGAGGHGLQRLLGARPGPGHAAAAAPRWGRARSATTRSWPPGWAPRPWRDCSPRAWRPPRSTSRAAARRSPIRITGCPVVEVDAGDPGGRASWCRSGRRSRPVSGW